jgi:soluble lytic murein transglycosylase-like protein
MARWPNENAFDQTVATAAARHGVPVVLIKAVIGQESGFDPNAYRAEPQINDASRGLMQVLLSTARGLGFTGDPQGLYDPATNVDLGAKLLKQNLDRGGSVDSALSAYNGGFRPSLGFGVPLANGQYRNQSYVDGVRANVRYFAGLVGATEESVDADATSSGSSTVATVVAISLVALLVALVGLRVFGGH